MAAGGIFVRVFLQSVECHGSESFQGSLATHVYLVEGHFASGFRSLRNQVLGRFPGFCRRLLGGTLPQVQLMALIAGADARSVFRANSKYIERLTGLRIDTDSIAALKDRLPVQQVPEGEKWRLGLLESLLKLRGQKEVKVLETRRVGAMLDSLCIT